MTTTAAHLWTCAHHWSDLTDALTTSGTATWPPAGRMADYLASVHRTDDDQEAARQRATALRALERSPDQIGEVRAPIRLQILELMQSVHTSLLECADHTASAVQKPVLSPLPPGYSPAYQARHELLMLKDRNDPRRWRWTGARPDAPYAALWLLARVQGAPGPFRRLPVLLLDQVAAVARAAAGQVERALDIVGQQRTLKERHLCGGTITLYGGEGQAPVAHCRGCGQLWRNA